MTQPLQGRRILVTGGATGIGAAAVQVLTAAGAAVVATYHRTTPPDRAGVTWVQCDLRDSAAVDGMVGTAVETLGGLDVLLHAAGLWQPGIPGQISGEDIDYLVDTNIKAMIFVNQAAYAVMRKGGGGRIINFGSGEAVMGSPISALYAATKGAVSAWTRSIARAWAAEKVSAIALAPAMQTPGADRLREFLGPAAAELIEGEIKRSIPLGGALGDPVDDLGPTLVFLCSEGSRFITGQLIAVDGGLVMLGA
ncbi:SDR family NAD(P)-dependent oxidoreductase [Mycolicibacterium moriokaense]|uniref:NAD(P)-dependent dehydrogenase (Short-subunit alcohol dehydrogenase family) n=1 Tax=Mycolicibacterium moriokaense TaxID=39691 RepID=A0A318HJZ6_9MYCO|nr:SDR family oxidoreductase [Mycolicibacterium moriokaense]PXX02256.1 NAD(P)-dependent dehydrogenase (short-subunit alcohol dehydrogenase family) [Mycolicibacterium moriokaense]